MTSALSLRAALKRGALVTAANWPVVLIDFTIESAFKFAMAIPVVGGALMVAVLLGSDLRALFGEGGVRATADLVVGSLASAPIALGAFLAAITLVAFGGGVVMAVIKAGTLAVLVGAERGAGDVHRPPLRVELFQRAAAYTLAAVLNGIRQYRRRAMLLATWLGVAYLLAGLMYITALTLGFRLVTASSWSAAWPLLVLIVTSTGVITITIINLTYDLMRVIVTTDDCGVGVALARTRAFIVQDARQVLGIFGVMSVVLSLVTAASVFATAGLTLIAWVPFAGLILLPLQAAAWLIRGLVFQYMGLMTLSAYQTQYRRRAGSGDFEIERPVRINA
ncbi:MAG TPA: hypothetical protein VES67_14800 [Vicinamibacterales bacterium]|nr:hypothetical protein [Vicinamibacterales bacterium]